MLDNAIPQGFEDAVELRRKNRETVVKYMNTKGQDRLRRHELFVEDGCGSRALGGKSGMTRAEPLVLTDLKVIHFGENRNARYCTLLLNKFSSLIFPQKRF